MWTINTEQTKTESDKPRETTFKIKLAIDQNTKSLSVKREPVSQSQNLNLKKTRELSKTDLKPQDYDNISTVIKHVQ